MINLKQLKELHLLNETYGEAGQAELSRLTLAVIAELESDIEVYREATIGLSIENIELQDDLSVALEYAYA